MMAILNLRGFPLSCRLDGSQTMELLGQGYHIGEDSAVCTGDAVAFISYRCARTKIRSIICSYIYFNFNAMKKKKYT